MNALLSLLQTIEHISQQLLDCLKQEKQALDDNQYGQLCELAVQKETIISQLNELDKQRAASCPDNNFNQFINSSNNQALISQWDNTRSVILSCQQQNEVNGRLLNRRNQYNQETIAILTGRNRTTDQTYNARGNQAGSGSLFNSVKA